MKLVVTRTELVGLILFVVAVAWEGWVQAYQFDTDPGQILSVMMPVYLSGIGFFVALFAIGSNWKSMLAWLLVISLPLVFLYSLFAAAGGA